jgi:hypothetical protein
MREILFSLLGAAIMFFVLFVISKNKQQNNKVTSDTLLKNLLTLTETKALLKTREFLDLASTNEFKNYLKMLTEEQIYLLAKRLTS